MSALTVVIVMLL